MKKIIFITGPVRSGKSNFAVELAQKLGGNTVFLATCRAGDNEMKKRISRHRRSRPKSWKTLVEYLDISRVIKNSKAGDTLIIDCITLWVTNLLIKYKKDELILPKIDEFINTLKKTGSKIIIVSNEVGWGIVPDNKLSRDFRDITGMVHQKITSISDEAYLAVAGARLRLK